MTVRQLKASSKTRSLPLSGLTLGLMGRLEQSTWIWEEPKVHIEQFISIATGTVNIEFSVPVEERYEIYPSINTGQSRVQSKSNFLRNPLKSTRT
ncbi:hypothetical protein NA56DRAFT_15304 [Hyaloscypha hepaticicola]|uniref:Uncharacterized protein n=1 Tax=Hyaloscypha hepaticicola TaxID=2082293 RepID=A0A2J6QQD1_9HELO|nr:hypothetical protein NA56DRAFT_15304 [Hyaloscypha hepaticicola]